MASTRPAADQTAAGLNSNSNLSSAYKGFGHPAAVWTAHRCVEKARPTGATVAGIVNSTHFGMAGYYAEIIAEAGMVGLATTNTSPRMAPWGAMDALMGTNPLAIAVPGDAGESIVLDMATSVAALGKITEAAAQLRTIPDGWALDAEGRPTSASLQMVYVLRGWAKFEYAGQGVRTLREGDCLAQLPMIEHRELECSDDWMVLEIVSPANFETRLVDAPEDTVDAAD